MKPNENQSPIGSGAESGQSNTKNLSSLPVGSDAPVNEKYHDQTALCKGLLVASAGEKDVSTEQRVPNFFPAVAPVGGIILYAGVLGAGVYSSSILWQLMQESQSGLVAVGVPALIGVLEFILVPGIKYSSLRDKKVAWMRAFVAEDRAAHDAAAHAAKAWNWKDWLALGILAACFVAKAKVLLNFGAFKPEALLAANWVIAILDLAFHLAGNTTRVPCYLGARLVDNVHLRSRRSKNFSKMGEDGKSTLGSLAFREFDFTTAVPLRICEVDGHEIIHVASDIAGHHYTIRCPGNLDDSVRATFLLSQRKNTAKDELARALARVQLELLTAPEMGSVKFKDSTQPSTSAEADDDDGEAPSAGHLHPSATPLLLNSPPHPYPTN